MRTTVDRNVAGGGDSGGVNVGSNSNSSSTDTDTPSRIKEIVFEYVNGSATLPPMIAAGDFDGVAQNVMSSCSGRARRVVGAADAEVLGTLATAILHYGLTRALVKSQRKIEHRGVNLDIVIPDAGTLDSDPLRALVICIMMTCDERAASEKIESVSKVQQVRDNIWLVIPDAGTPARGPQDPSPEGAAAPVLGRARRFAISYEGGSFGRIFSEIGKFQSGQSAGGSGRLRILGI